MSSSLKYFAFDDLKVSNFTLSSLTNRLMILAWSPTASPLASTPDTSVLATYSVIFIEPMAITLTSLHIILWLLTVHRLLLTSVRVLMISSVT